ncbi:MAG TPA: elongation factor G [Candidatus Lustribacter sp.]|nr:elongation factor G [Candidatus Lustribacter sp.]
MDISRRRNLAVVGLHHAGKTTLTEAILHHCGAIPRRGSVADGTTTTDFEPECIGHAQSTCVGFAHTACGDVDLVLIDAPGFVDFLEESKIALLAADAAVVVIDADPNRIPQTRALIDFLESRHMPHLFFINKMDRPGANAAATLEALVAAYGIHVVAEQLPVGEGEAFTGVVDLVAAGAALDDGNVAAARGKLLEALGDFDDHLLEELLDGVEPPLEEVRKDLHDEYARDQIIPVLFGSAVKGIGISELIAAIGEQFPSPLDVERTDIDGRPIEAKTGGPVVAQVCKTVIHPQSGKLSVVRIFSGTLGSDTVLTDTSRSGVQARPGGIYRLQGKKQESVSNAGPGEIVALSRLEGVQTLDTLTSGGVRTVMPAVDLPEPVFAVAIAPKDRLDEAKLSQMLARLIDEDPALRLMRAEFTNELELCGSGEMHLTVAAERLQRKYNVAVETREPQIAYRETIANGTEAHARYKHQTGGHGQFGEVRLRIEPRPRGHGVSFDEKVVGGAVPRQFFPAVEKGVREALLRGPNGFPVVDLHVTLYDGSFHAADSSEASFKTAAIMAMRDALPKCGVTVLEPISAIEVLVPEPFASATVSQLTAKRGVVQSFGPTDDGALYRVSALVPQAELAHYITELRTATQGLGSFRSRHERFDPAPTFARA